MPRKKRLPPEVFKIPVTRIKRGYYTDKYFVRSRHILKMDRRHKKVLMQVYTHKPGILCGMDEAVAILRLSAEHGEDLKIRALYDGDKIAADETVLTIEGDLATFVHLETVYLGVLSRGSSIATAVGKVVEVAGGKDVLFFSPRFDHYLVQETDGYAALIGGAAGVSTDAGGSRLGVAGIGTIPHALIAAYKGDTAASAVAFERYMPREVRTTALVDFNNDSVGDTLASARALGKRLWGVRLDTPHDVRDKSVKSRATRTLGVCEELVFNVRKALDAQGFDWVKIVISSGFDARKVERFVKAGVPFDAVGVGMAFYRERMEFTADVVKVDGRPCAKVGRCYRPNSRLSLVPPPSK
ncbi:MAG: quinolinate phosphoribosyl transferase [Planctomycetes bacterium DG_23]|nr:MAG: quinolinate phosphoribosyl transferase [Planctomycetes bacterium DG_23]